MELVIDFIIDVIKNGRIKITDHADEEAQEDALTYEDVYHSVRGGEIIELYLSDRPYLSCLIYGETTSCDPVHSVWGYNEKTGWTVMITVYRPDPKLWIEWRERRR